MHAGTASAGDGDAEHEVGVILFFLDGFDLFGGGIGEGNGVVRHRFGDRCRGGGGERLVEGVLHKDNIAMIDNECK